MGELGDHGEGPGLRGWLFAVSYGYGNRAEMVPYFWIDDLCELLD